MNSPAFGETATDAVRFWERGRLLYNLALVIVVTTVFAFHGAQVRAVLNLDLGLQLFALAVMANVFYCAAYVVDVFVQHSGFRETWRRRRWMLLALGTAFACVMAQFIARGLFAHPH